jgi:hypothetical protein
MKAGIRSRPWAGIDIGTYSIKLLATQGGVTGSRFWLAESRLDEAEAAADEEVSGDVIAHSVAACIDRVGLTPRSFFGVSIGLAGPDVIVKQISLPLMDDDEVAQALRFEARKHLPFDPQGMMLDYQILGRYASDKRLDVLLAAVSQERLAAQLGALKKIGMDADIVDAAPLALTNALVIAPISIATAHVLLDIRSHDVAPHALPEGRAVLQPANRVRWQAPHRSDREGDEGPFEEAEEFKLAAGLRGAGLPRRLESARDAGDGRVPASQAQRRTTAIARVLPHDRAPARAAQPLDLGQHGAHSGPRREAHRNAGTAGPHVQPGGLPRGRAAPW